MPQRSIRKFVAVNHSAHVVDHFGSWYFYHILQSTAWGHLDLTFENFDFKDFLHEVNADSSSDIMGISFMMLN